MELEIATRSSSDAYFRVAKNSRSRSRSPFKQRLEVGAGALRFGTRNIRCLAKAEIAVDQAFAWIMFDGYVGGLKRRRIGCTFVAQGIEPVSADDRRSNSGMVFCPQRRDAPVLAMANVRKIVAAEPFHHRTRQEIALGVLLARWKARVFG